MFFHWLYCSINMYVHNTNKAQRLKSTINSLCNTCIAFTVLSETPLNLLNANKILPAQLQICRMKNSV